MKPNVLTIAVLYIKVNALSAAEIGKFYCFLFPSFNLTEEATQWTNASIVF